MTENIQLKNIEFVEGDIEKTFFEGEKFDKLLLSEGVPRYHEDGLGLASCGSRASSKLNYVTFDHDHPTFMNSFCFFEINPEIARKIIEAQKPNRT